jgi:hypothetical protein
MDTQSRATKTHREPEAIPVDLRWAAIAMAAGLVVGAFTGGSDTTTTSAMAAAAPPSALASLR